MIFNILLQAVNSTDKRAISNILRDMDPYGLGMTAIGMGVVFLSLLLLYIVLINLAKLLAYNSARKIKQRETADTPVAGEAVTGEVNAAISMALYLYSQELHDNEPAVLTIHKTGSTYSPWSSKIYGLRQSPRN